MGRYRRLESVLACVIWVDTEDLDLVLACVFGGYKRFAGVVVNIEDLDSGPVVAMLM